MTDMAARLAAAAGNAEALLALAIELAQENAQLAERAAVLDRRRERDADRKRKSPRSSEEIHGSPQPSADVIGDPAQTPPPSPSLLPPTPPNNPSSPPSPQQQQQQAAQPVEEARLVGRAPEAWPVIQRFLVGKDATARMAWIGRFHGAMDRPPHSSGAELRDAIEDLMTRPREDWTPTVFRTYVGRLRRDAVREAERDASLRTDAKGGGRTTGSRSSASQAKVEAGRIVAQIRELAFDHVIPGQGSRRSLRAADVDALGPDTAEAFRTVGGVRRFLALEDKPDDIPFLINAFADALLAARATDEAKSA